MTSLSLSSDPSWSPVAVLKALFLRPSDLMGAIQLGQLPNDTVTRISLLYLALASLFFGVTSVIQTPETWNLLPWQLGIRFIAVSLSLGLLWIPLLTVVWTLFQKASCWFFDVSVPFTRLLGLSALGIGYYMVIFMLAIPILWLGDSQSAISQLLLFGMMLGAYVLTFRLFYNSYRVLGHQTHKRSLWVAVFPVILIFLVYGATWLLTYMAMHPHVK